MAKGKYASLGSISHATMSEEDLIPVFESTLDELGGGYDRPECVNRLLDGETLTDDEWHEVSCYLNEELFNALDGYAAPFCYFGAHEGDCSDYGFWVSWEALEDAIQDGEVAKVNAGEELPKPGDDTVCYFLEVNDHGNATLFTRDGEEVWSVV